MPIYINRIKEPGDASKHEIAWLCDSEWDLRAQVEALTAWLEAHSAELPPGEYLADLGFRWRKDAGGGGPVLEPATMHRMAAVGMHLYLSEYPGFSDEE